MTTSIVIGQVSTHHSILKSKMLSINYSPISNKNTRVDRRTANVTEMLYEETGTLISSGRTFDERKTFGYNGDERIAEIISWANLNSTPTQSYKTVYSYSKKGEILSTTSSNFNKPNWEFTTKIEYEYDSISNRKEQRTSNWRNQKWELSHKSTFSFGPNREVLNETYSLWRNNQWVEEWKQDNIYQGNELTQLIVYEWDKNQKQYTQTEKALVKTNSKGLVIEAELFVQDSTQWVSQFKITFEYDSKKNQTRNSELYKDSIGNWIKNTESIFAYDTTVDINDLAIPNQKYFESTFLSPIYSKPLKYTSLEYSEGQVYESTESNYKYKGFETAVEDINNLDVTVYPNPVNDAKFIKIDNTSISEVEIYNSIGKLVYKNLITQKGIIDMENIIPGVYFLYINNSHGNQTIKIIKN